MGKRGDENENGVTVSLTEFFESEDSEPEDEDGAEFDPALRSFDKMKEIRASIRFAADLPTVSAQDQEPGPKKVKAKVLDEAEGHAEFLRALGMKEEVVEIKPDQEPLKKKY